ncbi:UNVERIFIED_CONTAM: hypothetical protein PYX00_009569 [Menopon gallinae]|uniref:CRAL-TRIO domain-containing protein n=1 Tax=Menopon gallinae TaxID=328185 RepID=A0AAW2HC23_9NEOP
MLIVGSKSEDDRLRALLSKTYQEDLKKLMKNDLIASVQEWLKKQPHLPQLNDEEVLTFLHSCYYSAEKAKETIDNYFTFRTQAPEMFANRDPKKNLSNAFRTAYFILMPEECKSYDNNIIVILRLRDTDPAHANFPLEVKACLALLDFLIARFPLCNGLEVIMDMDGLTLTHILKLDLSILRKFMAYVQEALPIRLKAVHILNTFPLINQIMAIMRPLIKADLFSLLHFHTTADFDSFCEKYVPQDYLPEEYGGSQGKLETFQEQTYNDIIAASDWLKEQECYKVNESKRMGKSKWSEMNGISGTFKKLEID